MGSQKNNLKLEDHNTKQTDRLQHVMRPQGPHNEISPSIKTHTHMPKVYAYKKTHVNKYTLFSKRGAELLKLTSPTVYRF